jgi:hypothetical protein
MTDKYLKYKTKYFHLREQMMSGGNPNAWSSHPSRQSLIKSKLTRHDYHHVDVKYIIFDSGIDLQTSKQEIVDAVNSGDYAVVVVVKPDLNDLTLDSFSSMTNGKEGWDYCYYNLHQNKIKDINAKQEIVVEPVDGSTDWLAWRKHFNQKYQKARTLKSTTVVEKITSLNKDSNKDDLPSTPDSDKNKSDEKKQILKDAKTKLAAEKENRKRNLIFHYIIGDEKEGNAQIQYIDNTNKINDSTPIVIGLRQIQQMGKVITFLHTESNYDNISEQEKGKNRSNKYLSSEDLYEYKLHYKLKPQLPGAPTQAPTAPGALPTIEPPSGPASVPASGSGPASGTVPASASVPASGTASGTVPASGTASGGSINILDLYNSSY